MGIYSCFIREPSSVYNLCITFAQEEVFPMTFTELCDLLTRFLIIKEENRISLILLKEIEKVPVIR